MASTIEQELAAASDTDLLRRAIQTAKRLRVQNAQAVMEARFGELVTLKTGAGEGKTIAEEYSYAQGQYALKLAELDKKKAALEAEYAALRAPGADPARVTDDYLLHAVRELVAPQDTAA